MLKINDYCGFIGEKQEKFKTKRSCYSNGSVRLIIVKRTVCINIKELRNTISQLFLL